MAEPDGYRVPTNGQEYRDLREGCAPPVDLANTSPAFTRPFELAVRDVIAPRAYKDRPTAAQVACSRNRATPAATCSAKYINSSGARPTAMWPHITSPALLLLLGPPRVHSPRSLLHGPGATGRRE